MSDKILKLLSLVIIICLYACKTETTQKEEVSVPEKVVSVPDFNADSAYHFVKKQVDFGPRVPGTEAHAEAAAYFVSKLESYGAEVQVQAFDVTTFDNQQVTLKNIIASFDPEKTKRVLLAAHWDSRPFADKDTVRQFEAIAGANDGASGVGVLLEVARVISKYEGPDVGVDIIFFDGEDWGNDTAYQDEVPLRGDWETWWCLGSQYWSKNKHKPRYSAYYGILLDMVGAKGSQFHMEGYSLNFAATIVDKVWGRAANLGYGNIFVRNKQPGITDDHVFVNKDAKIPMINIVHYDPEHGYFGDYHHTHRDNMDLISTETLDAVGETILHVIYYE
ncbi:MAG: M28 family peptidase [Fulvivirga sp.]|nr:M28 family peptidase [Fulvivirga sp.]